MNKLRINKNVAEIIGKYLLPSFEDIKINKSLMIRDLSLYIINIGFYLNYNLISSDGGNTKYECNDFTNKKYKHVYGDGNYWTIRDI